jgi:hypothetical protein
LIERLAQHHQAQQSLIAQLAGGGKHQQGAADGKNQQAPSRFGQTNGLFLRKPLKIVAKMRLTIERPTLKGLDKKHV